MKRLILLLLACMLLVQVVAAVLAGTERGSRWLITLASPHVPGNLTATDISGTWLAGINIGVFHYQLPKIVIQAEAVQFKLDLSALWHGEVRASWLYANNVKVEQLQTSDASTTPFTLPEKLSLPVTLSIDDARLKSLSLHHPQRRTIQLDLVTSSGLSAGRNLKFRTLLIRRGSSEISADDGKVTLAHPYPLKADIRWTSSLPQLSTIFATDQLTGQAAITGSLQNVHIQHQLVLPTSLSSEVDIEPFSEHRDFSSLHHWQEITLMQSPLQPVTLENGILELSSESGRLTGTLGATLGTMHISNLVTRIEAEGSWKQAEKLKISVASGNSLLQASGSAHWQPGNAGFDLIINDSLMDAALIYRNLAGEINLAGNLNGSISGKHWTMLSDNIRIDGELMGKPVQASINAAFSQDLISVNVDGSYADNHADIDIRINDSIHGDASLSLQNLEALYPELEGAAEIQASLTGTRKAPQLDITVASTSLRFREYLLKDLAVKGENLGPASTGMMLDITSEALWHSDNMLARRTSFELNGAYSDHSIELFLEQNGIRVDGSLAGGMQSLWNWSGTVTDLAVTLPDNLPWQLLQPASLELSRQKTVLAPLCLSDTNGEACLDYFLDNGRISGAANLSQVALAPLSAIAGHDIEISGSLDSKLAVSRSPAGIWQGDFSATLREAELTFELDAKDYPLTFEDVSVSGQVADDAVTLQANVAINDHGYARASLTTGLRPDASLTGELSLALTELRWIELFIPHARQNRGHLEGSLTVTGARQSPQFSGALQLRNAGTDIPVAGLSLNDISAELSGNGPELKLSAEASSGPGMIKTQGSVDLSSGLPARLDLTLSGKRFLAIDLPEARVLIDPELRLRGSTSLLELRGDIDIPEAALRPQQIPEMAVRVSDDEVIVNAPAEQATAIGLDTDIMLRLGSNVRFSGFGLDAKLGGNLQLLSAPSRPVALAGELRIDEGRYRAYGQNLQIDRGLLIFQQRIDNPGLDIRAVRRIPSAQVVAGVAITGTLQSPEARLTSEPPMEESEIMAWLLTGRGLSGNSETDNAMIAQALAVYGLEKGSGVTEKIGEKVGLDEISVGSNWETTDASLMLGKQISNRLYLRYAIGLFDALSTVMLRYTVSRRVHLEAQSGSDQQSIDLIYQIER